MPNDKVKILDAPVHIGDLVAAETNCDKEEDENSIWIAKRDKSSVSLRPTLRFISKPNSLILIYINYLSVVFFSEF